MATIGEGQSKRQRMAFSGLAVAVALATAACPGNISHSYRTFTSALDRGAPCAELFDQRTRFAGATDLAKVDADLAGIGCTTQESARTDR
jgi:hypothetical protein